MLSDDLPSKFMDGMLSSANTASFDPDGDGILALILFGNSIGGDMKGGRPSSLVCDGVAMLYRNCRLELVSISRTDLIAVYE